MSALTYCLMHWNELLGSGEHVQFYELEIAECHDKAAQNHWVSGWIFLRSDPRAAPC
jgi:hypothetical protein